MWSKHAVIEKNFGYFFTLNKSILSADLHPKGIFVALTTENVLSNNKLLSKLLIKNRNWKKSNTEGP